jgi:soluble lytic murein transglycosylase-like protein
VSYIVRLKEKHGKNTLRSILIAYNGGPGKGGDNAVSRKYADEFRSQMLAVFEARYGDRIADAYKRWRP